MKATGPAVSLHAKLGWFRGGCTLHRGLHHTTINNEAENRLQPFRGKIEDSRIFDDAIFCDKYEAKSRAIAVNPLRYGHRELIFFELFPIFPKIAR